MKRLLIVALLFALPLFAALTPQEMRGRQIYRTGESPSGQPIVALMGPENLDVPATSLPCMSCHGRDGRGNAEGGIRPSNLQWHALTKPYSAAAAGGRSHPPYTPALLKRAITMGTDPAKQRLNPAMPRYRLSMQDADDLVAYLQRLGDDPDPGLTDDAVAIGLLLPRSKEAAAIRTAVRTHFDEVNLRGGIFGRLIRISESGEPFAYLAFHGPSGENLDGIPVVVAFSTLSDRPERTSIHLLPTVEDQCRALLAGRGKVRIVHDALTATVAASLASHHDPSSRTVLFLATPPALPTDADTLLVPAFFTTDAMLDPPKSLRAVFAVGTMRSDHETALAAARILTAALERAGRDVDREKLVTQLAATRRPAPVVMELKDGKLRPAR